MLGDVGNYLQGGGESNEIHAWMTAPYVADQIKVKPNLTLDFGICAMSPGLPAGRRRRSYRHLHPRPTKHSIPQRAGGACIPR